MYNIDPEIAGYIQKLSLYDKKDLTQRTLKAVEEVGELAKVVLPTVNAYATAHRFFNLLDIVEEVSDSVLCLLSILHSLNIDNETFNAMLLKKCKKWDGLQQNHGKSDSKLPFEIHITVDSKYSNQIYGLSKFEAACKEIGVKATVLELYESSGQFISHDVMTSSTLVGTNLDALREVARIENALFQMGFELVRRKIETVPWHPAAPTEKNLQKMALGNYFETHFELTIEDAKKVPLSGFNVAWSQNVKKKDSVTSLTVRSASTLENHERALEKVYEYFESKKVNYVADQTEFAIYDTNVLHDEKWINLDTNDTMVV